MAIKLIRYEREMCHHLMVGGFESIKPTVRLVAEMDGIEDLDAAKCLVDAELTKCLAEITLKELRNVISRRNGDSVKDDKVPQLMAAFKDLL